MSDHKYEALLLIEMDFEKQNRSNHAAGGTEKDRKNRGLSAELSSYHNGALPGGCVENPLSQTQRFRRRFHIFVDVDVFNRAFQTHA